MISSIVKDAPFISRGSLSGRWYFVESWRADAHGNRVAHTKHDVTDAMRSIISEHGGDPDRVPVVDAMSTTELSSADARGA